MLRTPVGVVLLSALFAAGVVWGAAEWWQRHRVVLVVRLPGEVDAA